MAELIPIRWPGGWKDPAVALLKNTPFNCLVVDKGATAPQANGLTVVDPKAPPAGVFVTAGEWPGIQAPQGGGDASAGPTGNPWVDSNGWKIRLERARHPQSAIWVDAKPKTSVFPASYILTIADAAAYGGHWIVNLDDRFAAGLAQGNGDALANWKRMGAAAQFFADRQAWAAMVPKAVVGVVSDFAGDNEFMGTELLNLVGRTNQQYRVILKNKLSAGSFADLKAAIYADAEPPAPALRDRILAFVQAGGLLITGPKWGIAPGVRASNQDNEGYVWRISGKGRIAFAKEHFEDPWTLAQESVLLISHRQDLLRFWNAGSVGSYFSVTPDGKRAIVHMLYYANRGPDESTVRVAGAWRSGKLWTLDRADSRPIEIVPQSGAVELHLPAISQYAAAELEA